MFASYSYQKFDCKLNASLFDLHGLLFVSSILYKSAYMDLYMDLQLSDIASTLIMVPFYSRH